MRQQDGSCLPPSSEPHLCDSVNKTIRPTSGSTPEWVAVTVTVKGPYSRGHCGGFPAAELTPGVLNAGGRGFSDPAPFAPH